MVFRLRNFREEEGYTQSDLAKLVGKSLRTVRMWETGESYPNVDMLFRLCSIFNTDPNTMLGWYDTHPRESPPQLAPDETAVVEGYRSCTPEWRRNIRMNVEAAKAASLNVPEHAAPVNEGMTA